MVWGLKLSHYVVQNLRESEGRPVLLPQVDRTLDSGNPLQDPALSLSRVLGKLHRLVSGPRKQR